MHAKLSEVLFLVCREANCAGLDYSAQSRLRAVEGEDWNEVAGKTGERIIILCRRIAVAVIDGMTFDQLMDFEDSHSISLGNSVPENIASTTETKSVTGA